MRNKNEEWSRGIVEVNGNRRHISDGESHARESHARRGHTLSLMKTLLLRWEMKYCTISLDSRNGVGGIEVKLGHFLETIYEVRK